MRVHAWFNLKCRDLVAEFAPWATESITDRLMFDAISCHWERGPGLSLHGHVLHSMNHWVVGFPDADTVAYGSLDDGDAYAETLFYSTCHSLQRRVAKTVANGDCGLDVMSLMLGMSRNLVNRRAVRTEICAYAWKHIANRALIAMLERAR